MNRRMSVAGCLLALVLTMGASRPSGAYPLDGYPETGIRRLEVYRMQATGEIPNRFVPKGAQLPTSAVTPRLIGRPVSVDMTRPDAEMSRQLRAVLGAEADAYGITVLDLTDPAAPLYFEHNGGIRRNVGSVGKILVGLAWFQALADVYPDDLAARERLLRDTWITADEFIISDHHEVYFYDPETGQRAFRKIREGDRGSLYDWLDWMLSASNNSAASTIQKQAMLLAHFGKNYPPSAEEEAAFWAETPASARGELYLGMMKDATVRNGLDPELFRQGSFFTRVGKQRVPGTNSYGNPREILKFLLRIEQGTLVDAWSSQEMKRLLYMTQKRIRYASHPALQDYAVYFKSGSLYRCKPEEGFTCGKYMGNDLNLLASIATIEGPVRDPRYFYLVVVSSNVLKKNSAVAHQTLAMRVHRMIEARHKQLVPDLGDPGSDVEVLPPPQPLLPFQGVRLVGDPPPEPGPELPSDRPAVGTRETAGD